MTETAWTIGYEDGFNDALGGADERPGTGDPLYNKGYRDGYADGQAVVFVRAGS